MFTFTINLELKVTHKLCLDFLTTCVEGGSSYWLACDHVVRDEDRNVTKIVGCEDREDGKTKWGNAGATTICEGIRRILSGEVKVRSDIRQQVFEAVTDEDSTTWDAETADCVLQAGLLNGIVYG